MKRMYPIAMGVSKKDLPEIKKYLKKQGYGDFRFVKSGKYFDIYYMKKKLKLKKVI